MLTLDFFVRLVIEAGAAAIIGVAFGMVFTVPQRFLSYIAVVAACTRVCRTILFTAGMEITFATFISCALMSLYFVYLAPKLKAPRPIFTVTCIIALIPGIDAYEALLAIIQVLDPTSMDMPNPVFVMFHHLMRAFAIILAIVLGIAIPPLFFYRYRKNV